VLSARARDERADPAVAHAAAAVATLEHVVGWPALAAAIRVAAAAGPDLHDEHGLAAVLESALGIPLDWFFAALAPDFRVNYRLGTIDSRSATCGNQHCYHTTIEVVRDGAAVFGDQAQSIAVPIVITIDFDNEPPSTIPWTGSDARRVFSVESPRAPTALALDPDRDIRLDDNPLDQRWRAIPGNRARPIKSLGAWVVWLQNAALSYGVLL
jgi:hypothetical protein